VKRQTSKVKGEMTDGIKAVIRNPNIRGIRGYNKVTGDKIKTISMFITKPYFFNYSPRFHLAVQ
jgi:hypothetical protein